MTFVFVTERLRGFVTDSLLKSWECVVYSFIFCFIFLSIFFYS